MSYTVFSRQEKATSVVVGYNDNVANSRFTIEYPSNYQYIPALGDVLNSLPPIPINTTKGKGLKPFSRLIAFDTLDIQCFEQVSAEPGLQISPKIAGVEAVAGSRAIVSVVGNGIDTPILVGFDASNGSSGYDGRTGIVNTFELIFTGYGYYYSCWQAINGVPLPGSGGTPVVLPSGALLNFAGLVGLTLNGTGGYSSTNTAWDTAYMISTSSMIADGYVTGRRDSALMLGLSTSAATAPYTNPYQYIVWGAVGTNYSHKEGSGAIGTSNVQALTGDTLRLKRTGGSVIASVLRANTSSFVAIHNYPTTSLDPLYANAATFGTGSIYDLRGGGF
jgi:hypothetical protein